MPTLAAARIYDHINHTSIANALCKAGAGLVVGAVVAAAVEAVVAPLVAAEVFSFGAATPFVTAAVVGLIVAVGPVNDFIESTTNSINAMIDKSFPPEPIGFIITGSTNVHINGRRAARAAANLLKTPPPPPPVSAARQWLFGGLGAIAGIVLGPLGMLAGAAIGMALATPKPPFPGVPTDEDKIHCDRHPDPQKLAEGSDSVLINGQPAHRKTERTTCGGTTCEGSSNVLVGGGTLQVAEIDDELPWWARHIVEIGTILTIVFMACKGREQPLISKLKCLGMSLGGTLLGTGIGMGIKLLSGSNPVHACSGAKILQGDDDIDFALPARLPLVWQRCYNSLDNRIGIFGRGVSIQLEVQLRLHQSGNPADADDHPDQAIHAFVDWQGREIPFFHVAPGYSHYNTAEGYRLACSPGGQYIVQSDDGICYDFGNALVHGKQTLYLQGMQDRNGNAIHLRRTEQGQLAEIADSAQRLYRLDYHPAHPQRVAAVILVQADRSLKEQGQLPRTLVSYDYDSNGQLTRVTNALGEVTRHFTWNALDANGNSNPGAGLLASHTTSDGLHCRYRWERFADHPRVVEHWTDNPGRAEDNERCHIVYTMPQGEQAGSTIATDHLGRTQRWTWNYRYAALMYQNEVGERHFIEWDAVNGQLRKLTQPNGAVWHCDYDERGNLIERTDPTGSKHTRQWLQDMPLPSAESEHGRTWQYRYDYLGNLIGVIDPAQGETAFVYDEHGQLLNRTDPRGGVTQHAWNIAGQLVAYTDCSQRTTHYDYDEWGHLAQIRDAAGRLYQRRNDALGRPVSVTPPGEQPQYYVWQQQRLREYKDARNGTTRYQWDAKGRLVDMTDALDGQTRYFYDKAGNLAELTNPKNESYQFFYDAADRLVAQCSLASARTRRTAYDALGLPVSMREAADTADEIGVDLERDLLGRLIEKRTRNTITHYHYEAGQVKSMVRWMRRSLPPLPSIPDHHSNSDDMHQQARLKELYRQREYGPLLDELHFEYDALGRLIEETAVWHPDLLAQAGIQADMPASHTLKHQYDALGNRIATTLPDGETLHSLYYGSGHLHQMHLDGQLIGDFERDALHREIHRTQGQIATDTRYAPGGQIALTWAHTPYAAPWTDDLHDHRRVVHPEDQDIMVRAWGYDMSGECTERIDSHAGRQCYQYDKLGRLTLRHNVDMPTLRRDGSRPTLQPSIKLPEESFVWDAASNLTDGHTPQGNRLRQLDKLQMEYDIHGQLTEKISNSYHNELLKHQTLEWNSEHQLVGVTTRSKTGAPETSRYAYDALGRRIASQNRNATILTIWQGMQQLQQRYLDTNRIDDIVGQHIATVVYQPGSYTPVARIETFQGVKGEQVRDRYRQSTRQELKPIIYHFHTAPNGTPEAMTNEAGEIIWRAWYAAWGAAKHEDINDAERTKRLMKGMPGPLPQNIRMPGQWHDRDTGLHYNTFRYYDPETARFVSEDPIGLAGGDNLYQYAPNPIGWIDPWGWAGYEVTSNSAGTDTLGRGVHVNVTGPGLPQGGHVGLTPNSDGTGLVPVSADPATAKLTDSQWRKVQEAVKTHLDKPSNVNTLAKQAQSGIDHHPNANRTPELKRVSEILNKHLKGKTNPCR